MNIEKLESKHPDYDKNRKHYQFGELLEGGTIAMRENAALTLPQEQREDDDAYKARINRSVLFNAYKQTIDSYSLKPFSKKVTFEPVLPEEYSFIEDDIDRAGMTVDQLSHRMVKNMLRHGKYILLVDMPSILDDNGKKISGIDEAKQNIHPFVKVIHPDSLIEWVEDEQGLARIKLKYSNHELVDDEVQLVDYMDVWTRETITTYKKAKDKEGKEAWTLVSENPLGITEIPLIIGDDINATPVLEDLAHLNVSHWRKSSDLDNILHTACVPFLHFAGFDKDDIEATVSVNNAYCSSDVQASISWCEVSGSGIQYALNSAEQTEAKMTVFGMDLITEKSVQKTATETAIDSDDDMSILQAVVKSVELGFDKIFYFASKWKNKPEPKIKANIFKEFNITQQVAQKAQVLLSIRQAGEISRETFLQLLDRLSILGDDFDVEEEISRIEDTAGDGDL